MFLGQADAFSRLIKTVLQRLNLLDEIAFPQAGGFQLFVYGGPRVGFEVSSCDAGFQGIEVGSADAELEAGGQAGIDDLGQATELAADGVGLADKGLQDAVLWPLAVDEVVAEDFGLRLELAVDAAIPLLHAAGIPGDVEMEQVPAVGLEVEAFAGGVGGDEDAEGVLVGRGPENQRTAELGYAMISNR